MLNLMVFTWTLLMHLSFLNRPLNWINHYSVNYIKIKLK